MKVTARKIELTCTVEFTENEVALLSWLAGYGGEQIAKAITKELTKEFQEKEWCALWSDIRSAMEAAQKRFRETKNVFIGNQISIWPGELERLRSKEQNNG